MLSVKGFIVALALASSAKAEELVLDAFDASANDRWEYIADGVMGGVSQGGAVVANVNGRDAIHLTGTVSTENNGGFIQVRRLLPDGLPAGTTGLTLSVRGNGENYYVFLRTNEMTRPWYYYSASFPAGAEWSDIRLPLDEFKVSHAHLAAQPDPADIISIGIVAYGRDHMADVSVAKITLD
ncbi:MAG: CIA30 family protein [Paracoccaceae bacterium]